MQKGPCWKDYTSPQVRLQDHSDKGGMILPQKQICRPMEQNIEPRNTLTWLQPPNFFFTKLSKTYIGKKDSYSTNRVGKTQVSIQKIVLDMYLLFCTKINSKYFKGLNVRLEMMELIGETQEKYFKIQAWVRLSGKDVNTTENNPKN